MIKISKRNDFDHEQHGLRLAGELWIGATPEVRHVLLAAAETREGDDKEELPRPTTVDAVAKVAAIFSRRVLLKLKRLTGSEM
jgi:hypothetical protein